jgi:hypothetical protein
MIDDYIRPDGTHSALFIIDVQRDTTLAGAAIEIPGTPDRALHQTIGPGL